MLPTAKKIGGRLRAERRGEGGWGEDEDVEEESRDVPLRREKAQL
jgi:hypothetical protein